MTDAHHRRVPIGVVLAVVGPLLLASGLVALSLAGDDKADQGEPSLGIRSSTTTTAPPMSETELAWQKKIDDAFLPLTDRLKELLTQAAGWNDGKVTAERFAADIEQIRPEFVKVRDAVGAVEVFGEQPPARDLYRESAGLYLEVVRIYGAAVAPDAAPLKAQLELASRRVRSLADRIYDRARVMLDPGSQQDPGGPDIEIRRPPEVPDWEMEGLAAGPPLADKPPEPPTSPPVREATREEQSEDDWLRRVAKTDLPSPRDLAVAIAKGNANQLKALATEFDQASDSLWAGPDPSGGRERAATLSLSLLVLEESARLGQISATLPGGETAKRLSAVAKRLALLGEKLEEDAVQGEPSGIDQAVLADTGP